MASLRRRLGFWETAAVSIGVMAPTLAMSLTGSGPAGLIGRAAPLAFVFAAVGVLLVAYGFVRLSAEFSSAGSVFAFVGSTVGPRAGFVTGWALLGTYLVFPAVSLSAIALFVRDLLARTGLAASADWYPVAVAGLVFIGVLGWVGIRPTSRALLLFEVVACLLILSLVVAIAVELADGSAPRGQSFSLDVLRLPPGVPVSTVALAATSGFLAFAGFESTGTLGEESSHPRRAIPRSMVTAIAVGAVFYVLCMCAQTLGFGTDALGVRTFADASTPLSDLAHSYVGQPLADVLDVGAALSAVGAGLGCAVVGTRMLLTFGRIGVVPPLAAIPADAPRRALAVELAITLSLLTSLRLVGLTAQHVFFYLATLGVLSLLVMYAITNVAAAQHLARGHGLRGVLLPVAGVLVAGYVLYRNVWPVPDPPFNAFPYLVAGWLALGALLAFATRWHFAAALHAGHDPAPHAVPKPRHSSLEPARVGDTDSRRPPRRA